jgi:hypothetical protein
VSEERCVQLGFSLLLIVVIALFIAAHQRDKLKEQAVDRGHAEWVTDSKGETKWQWKEVTK